MTHKSQWLQHRTFEFKDERFEMEKKYLLELKDSLESVLSGVDISFERHGIGVHLKLSREELVTYEGSIVFYYDKNIVQGIRLYIGLKELLHYSETVYTFDFETMTVPQVEIKKIASTLQEKLDYQTKITKRPERKISGAKEVAVAGAELLEAAGYKTKVSPMYLFFTVFRKEDPSLPLIKFTVSGNKTTPCFFCSYLRYMDFGSGINATLDNLVPVVEATNILRTIIDKK